MPGLYRIAVVLASGSRQEVEMQFRAKPSRAQFQETAARYYGSTASVNSVFKVTVDAFGKRTERRVQ